MLSCPAVRMTATWDVRLLSCSRATRWGRGDTAAPKPGIGRGSLPEIFPIWTGALPWIKAKGRSVRHGTALGVVRKIIRAGLAQRPSCPAAVIDDACEVATREMSTMGNFAPRPERSLRHATARLP